MNNSALFLNNQGEYDKALPLYEDCSRLRKLVSGENHPDTLISMNNLASFYESSRGEYAKAFSLYEECLRQRKVVKKKIAPSLSP